MKYRPIAFSSEMAQAIAEGRKTQTRQAITPQPHLEGTDSGEGYCWPKMLKINGERQIEPWFRGLTGDELSQQLSLRCPHGQPGERLWVREPYATTEQAGIHKADAHVVYKGEEPQWGTDYEGWQWKSPLAMPRWASRLTLEIISVRVERLQDITEADAKAEGAQAIAADNMPRIPLNLLQFVNQHMSRKFLTLGFWRIWNDLYGTDPVKGWDANPWVWVIEFRRVDA